MIKKINLFSFKSIKRNKKMRIKTLNMYIIIIIKESKKCDMIEYNRRFARRVRDRGE